MNDEQLKSYFLGKLPMPEAENLEEKIAADVDSLVFAQMIEGELLDDYLRGHLDAAERRLLEKNYLTNETNRAKLRRAESLWKIAGKSEPAENFVAPPAIVPFWHGVFTNYRTLAFVGLILAVLLGGIALIWSSRKNQNEVAGVPIPEKISAPSFENRRVESSENRDDNSLTPESRKTAPISINTNNHNNESAKPANSSKSETEKLSKPTKMPAFVPGFFTLISGSKRSEGEQFIKVSQNLDKITLRLKLPKNAGQYQTFRAVLKNAEGEIVETFSNLRSPAFSLPADTLENRTYVVALEGQNGDAPAESVSDYTFRVRR